MKPAFLTAGVFSHLCTIVGYDLAAEGGVKATLDEFDQEVGLHCLRAIHLNDSKGSGITVTLNVTYID